MLIPHLILMDMEIRSFPAGSVVLKEGKTGTDAFVLAEGEVVVDIGGKEITSVSERGAIFGEMATLMDRPRGATVTTTRDSKFYVIENLNELLKKSSDISIQLLKLLAHRLDEMNSVVVEKRKWWNFF